MEVGGIGLGSEMIVDSARIKGVTHHHHLPPERQQRSNRRGVVYHKVQSLTSAQETLNYWKQLPHILKYFRAEEDPTAHLPKDFMSGFLEGRN